MDGYPLGNHIPVPSFNRGGAFRENEEVQIRGVNPLFLHKALPLLVLPVGVCLLLLAVGWWRKGRVWIAAAAVVLLLFGMPEVGDAFLWSLEGRYPAVSVDRSPGADAIVVLGGILQVRRKPVELVEWSEPADRFERGVDLYLAGKAPALVLSRVRTGRPDRPLTEGHYLRDFAIRRGVPASAIVLTREVVNTASEAEAVEELARERGWKSILLVTSAFHMPRAMLLFRNRGFDVHPIPVDYQSGDLESEGEFAIHGYIPQGDGLARSEKALREYLGMAAYSVKSLFRR